MSGREVGLVDMPFALLGGRTVDVVDAAERHRSASVELLAGLEAAVELYGNVDVAGSGSALEIAGLADVGVDLAVLGEAGVELRLLGAVRPERARSRRAVAFEKREIGLQDLASALAAFEIDLAFGYWGAVVRKAARLPWSGWVKRRAPFGIAGRLLVVPRCSIPRGECRVRQNGVIGGVAWF